MAYGHSELSFTDKMTQSLSMTEARKTMIRKTYMLFSLSVLGMAIGGKIGMSSPVILNLFSGWMGWVLAMVALNAMPAFALKFRHNPTMGTLFLFLDGLVAGFILAPMLYFAEYHMGGNIVASASWITLAIFLAVSGYVFMSGTTWKPSRALMSGLFFAIIGAVLIGIFIPSPILTLVVGVAVGVFGVIVLTSATAEVINDENIDSPVPGALMLFSGVFMVFQAVMMLLMMFTGGGDD